MILGARLTCWYKQPASPHHTCKPLPASKAELMPVQLQGSVTRGGHAAEWKRPGSNHGLSVPEALLKQDCHLSPSVAPGGAPEKSSLRPGACRAAAGEELARRELGQVRHLVVPVSTCAGALRGTAELQVTLMAGGWWLLHGARDVHAQKRLAGRGYAPSLVNSACYRQGNGM